TVRQYGRDRLSEAGEDEDVRERHGAYYLRLAEGSGAQSGRASGYRLLARENANLRAALEWFVAGSPDGERTLRLAQALQSFWVMHGCCREGREWLARMRAVSIDAPESLRARALCLEGDL